MKTDISTSSLNILIALYTVVAQNARFCHWNVVWPHFEDNHEFFGELYDELSEAIDSFAERIRAIKQYPISQLAEILTGSQIIEYTLPMTARNMQKNMLKDYEYISEQMEKFAESSIDLVTQDIIIGEKRQIDKRAWMLRSLLGE
jgi:starvation-inducible DNA-binding protein